MYDLLYNYLYNKSKTLFSYKYKNKNNITKLY